MTGRAGRPPKAKALKVIQGTWRADRDAHRPWIPAKAPRQPPGMSPLARGCWQRLAPKLVELGLLTELDRESFTALCESWALYRRMEALITELGETYETKTGFIRPRPEIGIRDRALSQLQRSCAAFGLEPVSRSRLNLRPAEDRGSDEDFLFGKHR